ncbi:hypothetical protein HY024_01490 [Candidatus Curtissbacteria bacterium]|nr:hypothetical protein [Candidatus Curtissbacteria bacterium]
MNLDALKSRLSQKWILYPAVIIVLILFVSLATTLTSQKPKQEITQAPPQIIRQPVTGGKFDEQAPVSQKSKTSIERLLPFLPYRQIITTSAGDKVTFVVIGNQKDLYDLYLETAGINFQLQKTDPDLPRNVLNLRETASTIFAWLNKQNVSQTDVFIVWGNAVAQKSAESWLKESPQFPKVVKKGNQFVFEKQPQN